MDGYGTASWTCGECGDTFSHGGVTGDIRVERWARYHKEQHRVEKMTQAERDEYYRNKFRPQGGGHF